MACRALRHRLLIAACGLIYELVAGALARYLLGTASPVLDGNRHVPVRDGHRQLALAGNRAGNRGAFRHDRVLVALVGGFSATILFLVSRIPGVPGSVDRPRADIGIFVGLEIPLMIADPARAVRVSRTSSPTSSRSTILARSAHRCCSRCGSCRGLDWCGQRSVRIINALVALCRRICSGRCSRRVAASRRLRSRARALGIGWSRRTRSRRWPSRISMRTT